MVSYTASCEEIEQEFRDLDITVDAPGFYNHPAFVAAEKGDPTFLNNYARFVACRQYSAEYLSWAEERITKIAAALQEEIQREKKMGACMGASAVLLKILEREGVWSYQVKGGLTISFPLRARLNNVHFYPIVLPMRDQAPAAHSWVAAPPFNVVDVTIKHQDYPDGAVADYLPEIVLEKSLNPAPVYTTEVCSPASVEFYALQRVPRRDMQFSISPQLREFFKAFSSNKIVINGVHLKYFPSGIMAPEEPLEQCRMYPKGQTGDAIYDALIKPALS